MNLQTSSGLQRGATSLLRPILDHPALRAVLDVARSGSGEIALAGLTPTAKAAVVAGLAHRLEVDEGESVSKTGRLSRPIVVITRDNEAADRLAETASTFREWLRGREAAGSVGVLPAFDCTPYEGRSPHAEIAERRAVSLWNLARGRTGILFAPVAAALGRFRSHLFYRSLALELKAGDEVSLDDLAAHLASVGYEQSEPVSEVGQFSVRGGIVDIFPPQSPNPFRIEFFGDLIESLREFDPGSQRSQKPATSALLLPLTESARSPRFFSALVRELDRHATQQHGPRDKQEEAPGEFDAANREAGAARPPSLHSEPDWAAEYSVPFPGWEFFVPLVEPHSNTLFSLLTEAASSAGSEHSDGAPERSTNRDRGSVAPLVVWDDKIECTQELRRALEGWATGFEEVRDVVPPRPHPEDVFLTEAEFLKSLQGSAEINLKELAFAHAATPEALSPDPSAGTSPGDSLDRGSLLDADHASLGQSFDREEQTAGEPERQAADTEFAEPLPIGASQGLRPADDGQETSADLVLPTEPAPKFHGAVRAFADDVRDRLAGAYTVAFIVPTAGKVERLREILKEYEIPFASANDGPPRDSNYTSEPHDPEASEVQTPRVVLIARGRIHEGVVFPELKLALLSDADLFGEFDWAAGRRERSTVSTFISDLSDLKVGDYVVHVDHGIGQYQGLRQLGVENAQRDFMLITYQDDAKLYVPLERLDLVERYRSADGGKPVLDRLGGVTWARTKARVKRALRDMAQELLQLYAQRKMKGGFAYAADTPWQKEFENAFEFEETPDQLKALEDIKQDLESPQPMDRLLCGDVGYGKTELAMRAAFKVVQDGKQVAVLAPTTVLAFQHFNTFKNRMAAFPVRIEMVSRFRTAAEQKKILQETEAGQVDILIGTHRLLSKDVAFREVGLMVVDEEQRFGVAAKEKLKKLAANVEVLTMSATPIPRTLNMALGGLRDLSVIETPPRGRLAIQTVVAPFGPGIIQAAILQEMERQGQVYFVHNRVESIFTMADMVQKLVPTVRIGVAHGQMGEKELERVMLKFIQGQYDVLVSTVLIENGLDIPRANTLIVNHAERFGLADLYQLRGRVGRSNRRAYAYFLVPAEEALTPIAKRRLAALKEFSDLGAGFRLAALDLELRGAGNLLGAEQSGHLNSVGIDLYLRMLEQTVAELKGGAAKPEVRTTLNLGLDIKIPDRYIADERQRLRMYKRISSLSTQSQRADLEAELIDRYGPLPASVSNLFNYALLKSLAERLLVESIERKGEEIWMRFHPQATVDPEKLKQFVRRHRGASFRPDGVLRFRPAEQDGDLTAELQEVLEYLQSVPAEQAENNVESRR